MIIHDGIKLKRIYHYGWRWGNPETDVDRSGNPVPKNGFVLVRVKDCPVKGGYYSTDGVPQAIKLSYGGTYYGYGTPRRGRWDRLAVLTIPYFLVRDGSVFAGTIHHTMESASKSNYLKGCLEKWGIH